MYLYLTDAAGCVAKTEQFLNDSLTWDSARSPLLGHRINSFQPLMQRIDKEKVDAMVEASKEELA